MQARPRRADAPQPGPFTPGYLIGALAFAASLWLSVWFTAQILAPKILASTSVTDLQSGVSLVTTLMVLASFSSGLVGGAAGARQSRRDPRRTPRRVVLDGLLGPVVIACGLIVMAWLRHRATPVRSTTIDLALVVLGALAGALLTHRKRRLGGSMAPATLVLIGLTTLVSALAVAPGISHAEGGAYHDIDAGACTVRSIERTLSATVTVASIDLGGNFGFSEQQTRDGKWSVEVSYGAVGGFTLSEGVSLGKVLGASLSVSGSGHLTLTRYNTYHAMTESEADSIVRWAVGPYLADAAALPGIASVVEPVLRPVVHAARPDPVSTELRLGGTVHLQFAAAAGEVNLDSEVEFGSGVSIELANDSNHDPSGVTNPDEIKIGLDLKSLLSASYDPGSLSLEGDGEMTLSVKLEHVLGVAVWAPDTLALGATLNVGLTGTAEADLAKLTEHIDSARARQASEAESKLLKSLRTADVQLEAGPNAAIGVVAQVPELLKHPRTLSALVEYLGTIAPLFEHKQVSSSQLERASRTLAESFAHDADIGITGVVGTDVTGKFELLMGDAITFGLDAEMEAETGALVGALYRNGPDGLALSQTCYADHHE